MAGAAARGAGRVPTWVGGRLVSARGMLEAWAAGVGVKGKIFGIALLGGATTTLVMFLSLVFVTQIGNAGQRELAAVELREELIGAHLEFEEVRRELFKLTANPGIGSSDVQKALGALGEAGSALDANGLPREASRDVGALKIELVTFVSNARAIADRIVPGQTGPEEMARFDGGQAPLESLFHHVLGDADKALEAARSENGRLLTRAKLGMVLITIIALATLLLLSFRLTLILVRQFTALAHMTDEVRRGNLSARTGFEGTDEISMLARGLDQMAESIAAGAIQRETAHRREIFRNGLGDALDMIDNEFAAARVIQRALAELVPEEPAEVLLADSSRAHLRRVARNPLVSPPDCQVGTPFDCAAVRKSSTLVFDSSTSLSACPVLAERGGAPCSAVCVPVSFMGESLGVVHTVGPEAAPLDDSVVKQIETLASQVGNRIGTLRAFSRTHLQATTDGLTGILNRRSFEDAARRLVQDGTQFALVMCDLDHFKSLNDTHGHETGDRALRLFARVLKETVRTDDIVARFGGEEFVIALTRSTSDQATKLLERVQSALSAAILQASVPSFTASFGVAVHDEGSMPLEDVLRAADGALYQAKSTGRNRIVVTGQLNSLSDDDTAEAALGDALLEAL